MLISFPAKKLGAHDAFFTEMHRLRIGYAGCLSPDRVAFRPSTAAPRTSVGGLNKSGNCRWRLESCRLDCQAQTV